MREPAAGKRYPTLTQGGTNMMLALVVLVIAVVAIAAIVLADRYQYRVLRYKKYRRELPRRLRKSLD